MKIKSGIKILILDIVCLMTLLIGADVFFNTKQTTTAYSTETTLNTELAELNVTETRIDGWRAIKDMTIYGPNDDNGCGMTAMGILLQYYNDNSLYAGEILPDDLNYATLRFRPGVKSPLCFDFSRTN